MDMPSSMENIGGGDICRSCHFDHGADEATQQRQYQEWRQQEEERERQRRATDPHYAHQQDQDTDCADCYPYHPGSDCECDGCYEEYSDGYDDEPEEDYDVTSWTSGLEDDNDIDGVWIRNTRTVGCEFERSSYGMRDWQSSVPRGVGIGSDHCGPELRTPPLSGQAADRINELTLVALINGGTRTGRDSGLHVHVHVPEAMQGDYYYSNRQYNYNTSRYEYTEGDSEKSKQFAKLYALWYAVEHVTYRFDPSRRRNSYSEQLYRRRADRITAVDRALNVAVNGGEFSVDSGRYNSMNVSGGYGTVEFRNHGSSDDVPHVMAWIAFCQGMVDLSTKLSPIAIKRLAYVKSHNERAKLLMQYAKRHNIFTPTAYAAIRRELGLSPARTRVLPAARAA